MLKKILFLVLIANVIFNIAKAQDVDEAEEEPKEKPVEEPLPKFPPRCTYSYTGARMNKGCRAETKKCEEDSQVLVVTMVGDDYELCCCNY